MHYPQAGIAQSNIGNAVNRAECEQKELHMLNQTLEGVVQQNIELTNILADRLECITVPAPPQNTSTLADRAFPQASTKYGHDIANAIDRLLSVNDRIRDLVSRLAV